MVKENEIKVGRLHHGCKLHMSRSGVHITGRNTYNISLVRDKCVQNLLQFTFTESFEKFRRSDVILKSD